MKNIYSLTKRNCLLFFRSKQVVFFSLFSSLIIIALYFLFIAKLYAQGFNEASGLVLSAKQINAAIYFSMIMGVLVVNSISLSVGMLTFMARDFETRKTQAFLLTRVTPWEITLAYLISALIVSLLLNLVTLFLAIIIIGAATGVWLSAGALFAALGALLITVVVSCVIMLLITVLVRSSNAIGVINGVVGTIIGFLCGIYMPYSNMGAGAKSVGSLLPFTHFAVCLKQIALGDVFRQFGVPDNIAAIMQDEWFSAGNVGLCGANLPLWAMLLLSVAFGVVCLVAAMFLIKKLFSDKNGGRHRAPKE